MPNGTGQGFGRDLAFLDLDARILTIFSPVDGPEVNLLVDLLLRCDAENGKEITVYVSCQGEDIINGLKLVHALRLLRSLVAVVGIEVVEGAGLILLVAAPRRALFSSTLLSTADLWSLPPLHREISPVVRLHPDADPRLARVTKLRRQTEQTFASVNSRLPAFLSNPNSEIWIKGEGNETSAEEAALRSAGGVYVIRTDLSDQLRDDKRDKLFLSIHQEVQDEIEAKLRRMSQLPRENCFPPSSPIEASKLP